MSLDLLIQATGFGAFLWLALFLLSRADRQRPQTIISFAALFSAACLFLSLGLVSNTAGGINTILVRGFWWTDVFPMTLWLHVSTQIARREALPLFNVPMIINYTIAEALIVAGTFTDLLLDYSHPLPRLGNISGSTEFYYGPGIFYWVYLLYIGGAGLWSVYSLWVARQDSRRSELRDTALERKLSLLVMGGTMFLAGSLYLTLRQQFGQLYLDTWEWPGHLLLISALAMQGYSVAHYDMMVVGKNIQRDFVYSLTGTVVINLLYVILVGLVGGVNPISLFIIVALATTSHTMYDFGREQLDRLFFSQDEQQARSEAWAYATALASAPVSGPSLELEGISPEDEKGFNNAVRRAITSLKNPTQLVKSQLLALRQLERRIGEAGLEDNRLNRASLLRELLLEKIEYLRPSLESETHSTGDAWRFYNVLYFPYVREISRKSALTEARRMEVERKRSGLREVSELENVLNWLTDVDEDTFYKWQRKASDTIASILREEELRLQPNAAVEVVVK